MKETVKKLSPVIVDDEMSLYDEKAKSLAEGLAKDGVSKVHPIVLIDPETFERIVGYVKEPNYITKIKVMDKSLTSGIYTAADELRQACLIQNESNPLMYGEGPECDSAKLGVTEYCLGMVKRLQNQFKKK